MTKIPVISFKKLIAIVKELGFEKVRQRGSHIRFKHDDGRRLTIPDHGNKDVSRPLKNAQFCSSSRKAIILTTPVRSAGPTGQAGIH
jgi:predicted RNA binding protein YcfA (HicA-like mRNA interferase family)